MLIIPFLWLDSLKLCTANDSLFAEQLCCVGQEQTCVLSSRQTTRRVSQQKNRIMRTNLSDHDYSQNVNHLKFRWSKLGRQLSFYPNDLLYWIQQFLRQHPTTYSKDIHLNTVLELYAITALQEALREKPLLVTRALEWSSLYNQYMTKNPFHVLFFFLFFFLLHRFAENRFSFIASDLQICNTTWIQNGKILHIYQLIVTC